MKYKNKLFLVEDEEFFAQSVAEGLQNIDYEIKTFTRGEEMLDEIKNNLPDAIILDYHLDSKIPNAFNGSQILEFLNIRYSQIPVIILSNMSNIEEVVKLLKKGAVDFIPKDDFFFDNLRKVLDNIFELRRLRAEINNLQKQSKRYRTRLLTIFIVLMIMVLASLIKFT